MKNNINKHPANTEKLKTDYQQCANDQRRFTAFVEELTALSKKHGVAVRSTGGVYVFDDPKEAEGLVYTDDANSGDLNYAVNGQETKTSE